MTEGPCLMDRIRFKCKEDGDCLIWQGSVTDDGARPRLYVDRKWFMVRHLLWVEKNGDPKKGHRIGVSCGTPRCIAEEHLVSRNRSMEQKGNPKGIAFAARMAEIRRAKSRFTPEFIAMVRASPLNHLQLAKELGMHYQTVHRIRTYEMWKDYSSPFTGLGAR